MYLELIKNEINSKLRTWFSVQSIGSQVNVGEEFTLTVYIKNEFPRDSLARFKNVTIRVHETPFTEIDPAVATGRGVFNFTFPGDLDPKEIQYKKIKMKAIQAFPSFMPYAENIITYSAEGFFDVEHYFKAKTEFMPGFYNIYPT